MIWKVEKSYKVRAPRTIKAEETRYLERRVKDLADLYHPRPGSPPLGEITFRYELDEFQEPVVAHAYFINKHGDSQRFMRLRREA